MGIFCGFPMTCSIQIWAVDVGIDWGMFWKRAAWGLWRWQAVPSQGACLTAAPIWATARPPVLPALPGGWGASEAEEGCLTQAHTVTQGLGPGGSWGLAR